MIKLTRKSEAISALLGSMRGAHGSVLVYYFVQTIRTHRMGFADSPGRTLWALEKKKSRAKVGAFEATKVEKSLFEE